jgi:peptidoglycan-associated lipoprotein
MKATMRTSGMSLLLGLSLLIGGCSSTAKKDSGSSSDSLIDEATDAVAIELNGSSDDNTAGPLQTVYFDFDSSKLSSAAKSTLEQNAMWLKTSDQVDVQVEGHCDERGGAQYNLALGERRARTIKGYLEGLGVNSARISIVSYGKEKPNTFGHDEGAWSKNRRANFVITAK